MLLERGLHADMPLWCDVHRRHKELPQFRRQIFEMPDGACLGYLQGEIADRSSLSSDEFDEEECIRDLTDRSHGAGIGRYRVLKMMVLCKRSRERSFTAC